MKFQPVRASRRKGQRWKNLGMWNGNQFEKIVNLQNAEVTKMLDNKSEQKWPLAAKKRTDHKVRQSRVISFAASRRWQCVTNRCCSRYAIGYCSVSFPVCHPERDGTRSKDRPSFAVIVSGESLAFFMPVWGCCFVLQFPPLHGKMEKIIERSKRHIGMCLSA